MKHIYIFVVWVLLFVQVHQPKGQCVNGTSTNPAAPFPNNGTFKTNTFDWRMNYIPTINKNGVTYCISGAPQPSSTSVCLLNPFYNIQTGSPEADAALAPLRGGLNSDSKPEDGWELIKQDFGYAYSNNSWMGRTIFSSVGSSHEEVIYMMLYNRYTATLRIIANVDLSQAQAAGGDPQIVVKLSMLGSAQYADAKFSGLFNQYQIVQTALDQKTFVTSVTAAAQTQASRRSFTFVDFKLSYDPCICFWKSALNVDFQIKTNSTLKLVGRILGQSVDVADKNAKVGDDFLTGALNLDIANQPYNQSFYSEGKLRERIAYAANKQPSEVDLFLKAIKSGAKLTKGVSGFYDKDRVETSILNTILKNAKKYLPYLEFASIIIDLATPEAKIQNPTIITADLVATGRIEATTNLKQGFRIGTPGSLGAGSLPEYPSSSTNISPMYPMYNEVPGHFAVLRTPTLHYNYTIEQEGSMPEIEFVTKLPDNMNISYALGSLVDVAKTNIFVAIEVGGGNYLSPFLPIDKCKNLYSVTKRVTSNGSPSNLGTGVPFNAEDIKLVFQIFYSFKPDASGNSKTGYDLIKVKVNPVYEPTNSYALDPRYYMYKDVPTDLNIGNTTFPNNYTFGSTIFSFGDITITGNITNTGSTPLVIIASGDVNIAPNVTLTGNIEIRSNELFPPWITPVHSPMPPMSASAIQTFCQNSEYKAKESNLLAQPPIATDENEKQNNWRVYNLTVAPNPFKDELRVRFDLPETEQVKLFLVNTLGQVVQVGLSAEREKGSYEETLSTRDLPTGVYYLTLQTKNGIKTQKVLKTN